MDLVSLLQDGEVGTGFAFPCSHQMPGGLDDRTALGISCVARIGYSGLCTLAGRNVASMMCYLLFLPATYWRVELLQVGT